MSHMFGLLCYAVAITSTLALMFGLPGVMILGWRNRAVALPGLLIGAAYLVGGAIGWMLRPQQWGMAFDQTFAAAFNAAQYGHTIESQAERILMYPWYMAVFCSLVAAVGCFTFTFRAKRV